MEESDKSLQYRFFITWAKPGARFYPIHITFESEFLLQEVNKAKPGISHVIEKGNIKKTSKE